jgi:transposase-like protein
MKLCALVIIGVNERGEKHFLAIEDGMRVSTQNWREVLLKLKSCGMSGPELAIGDGAMGFWAALGTVTLLRLLDQSDNRDKVHRRC